jgi:hypothetical protein
MWPVSGDCVVHRRRRIAMSAVGSTPYILQPSWNPVWLQSGSSVYLALLALPCRRTAGEDIPCWGNEDSASPQPCLRSFGLTVEVQSTWSHDDCLKLDDLEETENMDGKCSTHDQKTNAMLPSAVVGNVRTRLLRSARAMDYRIRNLLLAESHSFTAGLQTVRCCAVVSVCPKRNSACPLYLWPFSLVIYRWSAGLLLWGGEGVGSAPRLSNNVDSNWSLIAGPVSELVQCGRSSFS